MGGISHVLPCANPVKITNLSTDKLRRLDKIFSKGLDLILVRMLAEVIDCWSIEEQLVNFFPPDKQRVGDAVGGEEDQEGARLADVNIDCEADAAFAAVVQRERFDAKVFQIFDGHHSRVVIESVAFETVLEHFEQDFGLPR